jgi:hypothetical protein
LAFNETGDSKMATYQVYIKDTDSCFFDDYAVSEDDAIEQAEEAYYEKYPEEEGNPVEWSVNEIEDDE